MKILHLHNSPQQDTWFRPQTLSLILVLVMLVLANTWDIVESVPHLTYRSFSSFSGADHLRSCTFALIVYICVCVLKVTLLPDRSVLSSDVLLYTLITHNSMWPTHTHTHNSWWEGVSVCVDVKTWICIVGRLYESSENRGALLFLMKSCTHTVSGGPEEYCGLWLKEVKEAQSSTQGNWKGTKGKRS